MIAALVMTALSGILESIAEISKWRRAWTWLPAWWTWTGHPLNIDGYHMTKGAAYMLMFGAGLVFPWEAYGPAGQGLVLFLAWLLRGNAMSFCYHFVFMKPEKRDFVFLGWFRDLFNFLGWGR